MTGNVLVTYASKYGATAEIARKIGAVLQDAGLQVDVVPVDSVQNLTTYQAVILGSAIYIGKWQKEAERFLNAHRETLANRAVWLFSSGPTGEGDPLELVEGQLLPPALKPVVDRIHPRQIAVFHGYMNPDKMNRIENWAIKKLVKKPIGDFRDWEQITSWATEIAGVLQKTEVVG